MNAARDHLLVAVNGVVHEVRGDDAFLTLSTWLRERLRLVGTKIVCSEGDCGACTVLVGTPAPPLGNGSGAPRMSYRAIDSCIAFLFQLDGCHVVTVEGLARGGELHPAQLAMAEKFGSQCGFCTPGFVVALAGLTEEAKARRARPDEAALRSGLSGNLCRCTGYVQILDAARAIDPASTPGLAERFDEAPLLAALAGARAEPVRVVAGDRSLALPATWSEALDAPRPGRRKRPWSPARPTSAFSGTRDSACPRRFIICAPGSTTSPRSRSTHGVLADRRRSALDGTFSKRPAESAPELRSILELFGAPQIRHVGTIGGNLVNASPIADSLPFLFASEAVVELDSARGRRTVPIADFYLGYKRLDLAPDELLAAVVVPLPAADELLRLLKVSRRRDLDISTFTAALWMRRAGDPERARIESARLALGGVGPTVVRAPGAEALLAGAPFELASFRAAGERAAAEIMPISDVRGSEATTATPDAQRARPLLPRARGRGGNGGNRIVSDRGGQSRDPSPCTTRRSLHVQGRANLPRRPAAARGRADARHRRRAVRARADPGDPHSTRHVPCPGVVAVLDHRDVPGANRWGPIFEDEPFLADDEIGYLGQPVVDRRRREPGGGARGRAPQVRRSRRRRSRRSCRSTRPIARGDLPRRRAIHPRAATSPPAGRRRPTGSTASSSRAARSSSTSRSQAAIAYPGEQGQMVVHSSTQNTTEIQVVVAEMLGCGSTRSSASASGWAAASAARKRRPRFPADDGGARGHARPAVPLRV